MPPRPRVSPCPFSRRQRGLSGAKEAARTAALQAKIDQVKKHLKENTQAADAPFEVDVGRRVGDRGRKRCRKGGDRDAICGRCF